MKKILNFDKEINFPTMIGEITSIALDHTLRFTSDSDIEGDFVISGTYKMTEASHLEEEFDYSIPVSIALTENLDRNTCKVEIEDFHYEVLNDDTLNCKIDVLVEGLEEIELDDLSNEKEIEVIDSLIDEKDEVDINELLIRESDGEVENDKQLVKESNDENKEKEEKEAEENSVELVRECDGDEDKEKEVPNKKKPEDTQDENNEEADIAVELQEVKELEDDKEIEKIEKYKELEEYKELEKHNLEEYEAAFIKRESTQKEEKMNEVEEFTGSDNKIESIFSAFKDTEETFVSYSIYILRKNDTLDKILDLYHVTKEELSNYNDLDNLSIGSKVIIPTQKAQVNE